MAPEGFAMIACDHSLHIFVKSSCCDVLDGPMCTRIAQLVHLVETAWISFANLHADNRPWLLAIRIGSNRLIPHVAQKSGPKRLGALAHSVQCQV